jgi:hypothetical protein
VAVDLHVIFLRKRTHFHYDGPHSDPLIRLLIYLQNRYKVIY